MNNYQFCASFIASRLRSPSAKVLDYGCGAGTIVSLCRERGIDAYGCDTFYEGGDYSSAVPAEYLGSIIRRMDASRIPFESKTFDWVVSNQVLEHVADLDAVLSEIHRVMKPNGLVLSLFPDRNVWQEGHCGIPFLHRFAKHSRSRIWYAAFIRKLGFGYHKKELSAIAWSENFCRWLDDWTYYRSYSEIRAAFKDKFSSITHHEDDWLESRLGERAKWFALAPRWSQRFLVRKMIGMVFVARANGWD
jgi:SAM-dependent methyltransferase